MPTGQIANAQRAAGSRGCRTAGLERQAEMFGLNPESRRSGGGNHGTEAQEEGVRPAWGIQGEVSGSGPGAIQAPSLTGCLTLDHSQSPGLSFLIWAMGINNHSSLARLEDAGHGNQVRQPLRCGYRRLLLSRAPGQGSRGLTVCTCACDCLQGVGSHAWHSLCCYHHLHRCYS